MRGPTLKWGVLLLAVALGLTLLFAGGCGDNDEENGSPTAVVGDSTGVTDTEIKIGTLLPLTGTAAAWGIALSQGMKAYFDYINDQGGVHGRKITFLIEDDHYNPPDTIEVVRKLVEQDKVFAIVAGLGENAHSAVWKYLEERNVPDMFVTGGLLKWSEPPVHSRFSGSVDFVTEGKMLGKYVVENYPGTKLGLLLQNDEMGSDSEKGLNIALEGSDIEIVAKESYEAINFDATAQTQRLHNAGAEVIIAFAIPPQAASLVKTARDTLNWDVPIIVSGINADQIFIDLAGEKTGEPLAEGVISIVMGHMVNEAENPAIKAHIELMEKYGRGTPVSNFSLYGAAMGELIVEILNLAGPDLTRESFLDAAESIRGWYCNGCMVPISLSPTDHRPLEMEMYTRVENGTWVTFGEPVSFESTPE